jgi:hypothetical protein
MLGWRRHLRHSREEIADSASAKLSASERLENPPMTRRVDPDFQFPDLNKRRVNWLKWLAVAAIVIALAAVAFLL